MKKILFTALFIAFAMTLGLSSTPQTNEQQATSAYSSYIYIDYHVGDITRGIESYSTPFTVNYTGTYLGCEGPVGRNPYNGGEYSFIALDYWYYDKRDNVNIGNVVSQAGYPWGQVYIYRIYANIK